MNDDKTPALSNSKERLLAIALIRTVVPGSSLPALKFRAEHHTDMPTLDELERENLLKRDGANYLVSSMALPLMGSEEALVLLAKMELLYGALRRRYLHSQDEQVLVDALTSEVGLPRVDVTQARKFWSAASANPELEQPTSAVAFPSIADRGRERACHVCGCV